MAKLTLLIATFALFFLVANASKYRTTFLIGKENPNQSGSCQRQLQRTQYLLHCQFFLGEMYMGGQKELRRSSHANQQQYFAPCCQQMRYVDASCRCEGLEVIARGLQEQEEAQQVEGETASEELEQVFETARNLPRMCQLHPTQGCQFSSSSPYDSS